MRFNLKNYQPKNLSRTAVVSFALLALISGCSNAQLSLNTPQIKLPGSDKTAKNPVNPVTNIGLSVPLDRPDKATNAKVLQYVQLLRLKGFPLQNQGVWMQSDNTLLANHQGTVPLPAASLSKVATTLVALQTFGPEHQFITRIGATGPIENGVLKGDLVVEGGSDPFFVWEEAFAVGNLLNQVGIKRVTGNLVVVDKFYMNFKDNPQTAGNLLLQGLNSRIWSAEAKSQYQSLPPGTKKPQVVIEGSVQALPAPPSNLQPLVRHYSYPLAELLKRMNRYSNNFMADKLADAVGGAQVVAEKAAMATDIPTAEIQMINGSGLAIENRISPRAVCAMFKAIENYLRPLNMTIADVFTIVGQDKGILDGRSLPQFAVVKSGSLDNVSALAGALPTQKQGTVWFVVMNSTGNQKAVKEGGVAGKTLQNFRAQQEALLKSFVNQWGAVQTPPTELTAKSAKNGNSRSEIVGVVNRS